MSSGPRVSGSARIIRGNALALPLADESVDLVVTSPPYFALRSYQDAGEHYSGQIGSEATPAEFVDALIAATREMVRVVKPSGSIWVNLGDKYASSGPGSAKTNAPNFARHFKGGRTSNAGYKAADLTGIKHKSLIGVPWRYALRCIDDLGLILRAEVIWSKPNGLPESVTDRVRRSHETWFHFTLEPRYYSAVDEIREAHDTKAHAPGNRATLTAAQIRGTAQASKGVSGHLAEPDRVWGNPLGKLPGSVWSIPTQPLRVPAELGIDHFAAFPMEWPRRIIQGWSPSGVCTACGEGRRPTTSVEREAGWTRQTDGTRGGARNVGEVVGQSVTNRALHTITGYVCACPEPTAPTTRARVLDPFGGTGTVGLVAKALGRDGIVVDMSADYCRLAKWRTTDEGELANAMQVEKPAVQIEGQISMLDLLGEESA